MSLATEFHIDPAAVRTAARRSLLIRLGAVILLVAVFGMAVNAWVPPQHLRIAWSFALTSFAVYAGVEVVSLQWARRSAPTMVLRLGTNALECWIGAVRHSMPYRELSITRVNTGSGGAVRSIELRRRQGERVVLAGFADMDGLAQALTTQLAAVRADREP